MKWLFRFQPQLLFIGLLGLLGRQAQKDAEEVSEELALAVVVVIFVGLIIFVLLLIAHGLGLRG